MLRDSIAHAHEDNDARNLREQQVDADRAIAAVESALGADGAALLSAEERREIEQELSRLRLLRDGTDAARIRDGISALDRATREFAARRMNEGISRALSGHRLEEFG